MNYLQEFERKLDLILNKLEITVTPTHEPEPEAIQHVRNLARQGKTIEAIKVYRQYTGASLGDAKDFVDGMGAASPADNYRRLDDKINLILRRLEIPFEPIQDNAFYTEIRNLLWTGKKIEAIKVYRETFNLGLKEAKDAVDAIEREMR
jgi:ribosomal protein L7/L12